MHPVRTRPVRRSECAIRPGRSRVVIGYQMTEGPLRIQGWTRPNCEAHFPA